MKKYAMSLRLIGLFFLLTIVAINCKAQNTEKKEQQSRITKVDIPLDNLGPDSKPSLTRNIYFIFDGSGSMADLPDKNCKGDKGFASKITGAKWAVKEFLKKVPKDINIGLYVFDSRGTYEAVPLGPDNFEKFVKAINKVNPGGQTPLAKSIMTGTDRLIKQYKKQLGYGEFRLLVVTDGQAEGIPDAAIYATKHGIPIYAIGLCIGQNHPLRKWAVSYRAADNFQDLAKGLEETLAEMPAFDLTEFNQ